MSLFELINQFDKKLQAGADTISVKVNEYAGLSNYHISSLFLSLSATYSLYGLCNKMYGVMNGEDLKLNAFFNLIDILFLFYQIKRNFDLENKEKLKTEPGDAVAVDFTLLDEKKSILSRLGNAKPAYGTIVALDAILSAQHLTTSAGLLFGQYFREVDYLPPSKRNKISRYLDNLIHKPHSYGSNA